MEETINTIFKIIKTKNEDILQLKEKLVSNKDFKQLLLDENLEELLSNEELTESERNLIKMFYLRYKVFIENLNWLEGNEFSHLKLEFDEFDENNAIHIGLEENKTFTGYLRLIEPPYMINEVPAFNQVTTCIPKKKELECTRFCISSKADKFTFSKLLTGLITTCSKNDIKSILGLIELNLRELTSRTGLDITEELGNGKINKEEVSVVEYSMSKENLERIIYKNKNSLKEVNDFKFEFFGKNEEITSESFSDIWEQLDTKFNDKVDNNELNNDELDKKYDEEKERNQFNNMNLVLQREL